MNVPKSRPAFFISFTAACLLAATIHPDARAALIAYEPFEYTAGSALPTQNGGVNWGGAWGNTTGVATNAAGSLSYMDGLGNSLVTSSNHVVFTGLNGNSSNPSRPLSTVRGADGTTTWISFLGRRIGPVTNTSPLYFQRVVSLQLMTNSTERIAVGRATTNNTPPVDTWSIYANGSGLNTDASSVSLSNAPSSLLVLRVDHVAGNDNAYLFVNPTLGVEPSTSSPDAQLIGTTDLAFNTIRAFAGNTTAAGIYSEIEIDEIRIGTNYADVTPYTASSQSPSITTDLTNQTAQACADATFAVIATGAPSPSYHWFFNNAPTNGSGNSFSLTNVAAVNAGNYFVIVSNSVGKATSSVVSLTVVDTTSPSISQCATNQTINANGSCMGIIPDLTPSIIASDCSGIASITQSPLAGTTVGIGSQVVTLFVTDISNNVASCTATVTVVSVSAPTIVSCASDQFLNADTNQQALIPNLASQVIATNLCGSVVVTQSPPAGVIVGPGTNIVTLTAGGGGNTTNCIALVVVNARPVASSQSVSTGLDDPIEISLVGNDPDNGPLTFVILADPAHGSLGTLSSNLVTYTPDEGYVGADSFTFNVGDGQATSAVATVSLAVTNADIVFPSGPQITNDGSAIVLVDYAILPLSGRGGSLANPDPVFTTNLYANQLARANFLRSEPPDAPLSSTRFFVPDLNRSLYILTKTDRRFTNYINFQAVFPKFDNDPGYAGGLVCVQFDPGYSSNGIFYTVHTEDPAIAGTAVPTNNYLTGLNLSGGYTTTSVFNPPAGTGVRQGVLVEWTDTNIANDTFEGTAREIMRVGFNGNLHPMGDLAFNPNAQPGNDDWRNLYISNGDGGSGETPGDRRTIPQRLDAVQGKILRITPDTTLRPADELSSNSRYRIPTTGSDPNPFISLTLPNVKKEIYAYGFRNPHRMSWDPISGKLFSDDIGLHAWEEVNIIHKGTNYGYSEREGVEQLLICSSCGSTNGKTGSQVGIPFPSPDLLIVTNGAGGATINVAPTYPVALYSHADGDAISSGFVYRGSLLPSLQSKYIFGEITTGRLFYCDLADLIASDDGFRTTVAPIHEIQIVFDTPYDSPDLGLQRWRMYDIVANTYTNRGGTPTAGQKLPGSANATAGSDINGIPYGKGRVDIRLALGGDGEMYVISKSDGLIRQMTTTLSPPNIQSVNVTGGNVGLTWQSVPGWKYRVQNKTNIAAAGWTDIAGDVTASGITAGKTNAAGASTTGYYRVEQLP